MSLCRQYETRKESATCPEKRFIERWVLPGDWVVDVWESHGGEIEVFVEPPRES